MKDLTPKILQWTGDINQCKWLFYQGRDQSQVHAGLYIGNQVLISTTGEAFRYDRPSIHTIPRQSLWLYPEIKEVKMSVRYGENNKPLSQNIKEWYYNILTTIKGYFLGEAVPQFLQNHHDSYVTSYPQIEQGSLAAYSIQRQHASLAQTTDKKAYDEKFTALKQYFPNSKIIAYGASRGASTTLNAIAEKKYPVKLCIIESPFDDIEGVCKSLGISTWLYHQPSIRAWILGHHNETSREAQPRGHVKNFPNDIPLVIISSQKDEIVTHENTIRLALRLACKRIKAKTAGEKIAPVYFLQLDNSRHTNCCNTTNIDGIRYQNFIHHLYKINNLPYIESYANQCQENLAIANLTSDLMKPLIMAQDTYWQNKTNRYAQRQQAFNELETQLNACYLDTKDKLRLISIATAMPLFSGEIQSPHWFFTPPINAKAKLMKLYKEIENIENNYHHNNKQMV